MSSGFLLLLRDNPARAAESFVSDGLEIGVGGRFGGASGRAEKAVRDPGRGRRPVSLLGKSEQTLTSSQLIDKYWIESGIDFRGLVPEGGPGCSPIDKRSRSRRGRARLPSPGK